MSSLYGDDLSIGKLDLCLEGSRSRLSKTPGAYARVELWCSSVHCVLSGECDHESLAALLPHLAGVTIDRVRLTGSGVQIWACARADRASCGSCAGVSARVHSRYERRLADAVVGGRRMVIRLRVRRFFCDHDGCPAWTVRRAGI